MVIFEDTIQMLRTSMADLNDEIARNTHEITRCGLMSGIDCIRTLLNEIRDVGYHLYGMWIVIPKFVPYI
jgi:hypothetical protein